MVDATTSVSTAAVSTGTDPAVDPTASQQSAFDQAMAQAQLGVSDTTTQTSIDGSTDPIHLAVFSYLQNSLLNMMAQVDENRKEASQDDDD